MVSRTRSGFALVLSALVLSAQEPASGGFEALMKRQGLVDVRTLDRSLQVDLKYSSADNFMREDVYGDLDRCYLQKEVAAMLAKAQTLLKRERPGLSLKVFDGARPRRVQEIMWRLVKGTDQQKYVASPASGSIHNYGSAVDLTICDGRGVDLDMGTPYDFLGILSQPRYEATFLKEGKLTQEQVEHRVLLRDIMTAAGFASIPNEWWHFDAFSRSEVKKRYRIIE